VDVALNCQLPATLGGGPRTSLTRYNFMTILGDEWSTFNSDVTAEGRNKVDVWCC
jgi:hypothetical protein